MSKNEIDPTVLLFDNFDEPLYLDLLASAAEEANWQALSFSSPDLAASALERRCADIGAIVTTLGWRGGIPSHYSLFTACPARPIISLSNKLGIPRAVMTNDKNSNQYIRNGRRDIVIPLQIRGATDKVTTWLGALVDDSSHRGNGSYGE